MSKRVTAQPGKRPKKAARKTPGFQLSEITYPLEDGASRLTAGLPATVRNRFTVSGSSAEESAWTGLAVNRLTGVTYPGNPTVIPQSKKFSFEFCLPAGNYAVHIVG